MKLKKKHKTAQLPTNQQCAPYALSLTRLRVQPVPLDLGPCGTGWWLALPAPPVCHCTDDSTFVRLDRPCRCWIDGPRAPGCVTNRCLSRSSNRNPTSLSSTSCVHVSLQPVPALPGSSVGSENSSSSRVLLSNVGPLCLVVVPGGPLARSSLRGEARSNHSLVRR